MKSKAEILKAVDTCAHTFGRCIECPYCDDTAHCVDSLVADLREALIKSDYEVVKEVLDKSLILDWEHYSEDDDYYKTKRLSAKDACGTVYELAFDLEGNIL